MRRGRVAAIAVAMLLASCADDGEQRTVRVDFRHDEFASHYWRYFPGTVYAHPGDEILFDQQWTGEPHTVTFGTIVDDAVPRIAKLEKKYADFEPKDEADAAAVGDAFEAVSRRLPIFDPYTDLDDTNAVRPCYLDAGVPPQGIRLDHTGRREPGGPCPQREQPEFDGRQAYYSSGFISPNGADGNEYRLPLSDDIAPGSYSFYCIVHFPEMQGELVVKAPAEDVPSASEVSARARAEIEALARPLRGAFAEARAGRARDPNGDVIELPVAGYHAGDEFTVAVDEFVPKVLHAKAGEAVTWTVTGVHTVSFDVPSYAPIYRTRDDGTIERNPVVDRPAGGSPKPPAVDFSGEPVQIDAGTWDGDGFISSGLLGAEPYARYTLRVSKPGRYRYACLVHPPMVGTLVVDE